MVAEVRRGAGPRPSPTEAIPQQQGFVEARTAFEQWWGLAQRWEGGFVNDPNDRGGATNTGLTLSTARRIFQKPDLTEKELAAMPASTIRSAALGLYNHSGVERLTSSPVRAMVADLFWGGYNEKALNRALVAAGYAGQKIGLEQPAGKMSDAMIAAINSVDPERFLNTLYAEYRNVREANARGENQGGFRTGWLQRLGSFYVQAKLALGGGAALNAAKWYWQQSDADRAGIGARLTQEQQKYLSEHAEAKKQ